MSSNTKTLSIIIGDITEQHVDAIVNAANSSLRCGGGVDYAIHKAAGPSLDEECRKLKGCKTGKAKITKGYNLPAKYVIHTVGPIWKGGNYNEEMLLKSCYNYCFKLADEYIIKSIAFCSISTGAFGFPLEKAAPIAIKEMKIGLQNTCVEKAIMVCFGKTNFEMYRLAENKISALL